MPDTLPTSALVTLKHDYKRTPAAFGKLYCTRDISATGTTDAGTDQTKIVDAERTESKTDLWKDYTAEITSGTYMGMRGTVTAFTPATDTLTISGFSNDPGVGATYRLIPPGEISFTTQSSADDVTYSAAAALDNGQEPGVDNATPAARYLKTNITLTAVDYLNGPTLNKFMIGSRWRMGTQQVGANISSWLVWLAETTAPAGTSILQRVRLAKTAGVPAEGDYGAWQSIVSGNNVGTILTDVPPPAAGESRWIDAEINIYPSAVGVTPNQENFSINWLEGSNADLTVAAFIYHKRLYLTGISSESPYNNLMYVLDSKGAWTKFMGRNIFRLLAFRGLIYGLSAADDKIFKMEIDNRYDDNGTNITAYISTGALDFGNAIAEMQNIKLRADGAQVIGVYLSKDGKTWTLKGTIAFTAEGVYNMRVPRGWVGSRHFIRLVSAGRENMGLMNMKVKFLGRAEA